MVKNTLFLFFLFWVGFVQGQDTTPIAKYPFQTDATYQGQIKILEERYESTNTIQVLDSLANLAFEYKDWETSMNYGQMAVELEPTAQRHFLLGGAAGFRALEVSIFSSLKYVNIMKPAFEEAARLEPSNTLYLRAQVDVLVALPTLLGGDLEGALKIIEKIKFIDPLEGLLAEGSFYEKTKDRAGANEIYQRVFEFLEQTYPRCSELFFDYLKSNRRDLAYDLGRVAADYDLSPVWGQCALSYFEETHRLRDTVPLAWVFYQRARLAKRTEDEKELERYLKKSLAFSKAYPELKNLIKTVR